MRLIDFFEMYGGNDGTEPYESDHFKNENFRFFFCHTFAQTRVKVNHKIRTSDEILLSLTTSVVVATFTL